MESQLQLLIVHMIPSDYIQVMHLKTIMVIVFLSSHHICKPVFLFQLKGVTKCKMAVLVGKVNSLLKSTCQ